MSASYKLNPAQSSSNKHSVRVYREHSLLVSAHHYLPQYWSKSTPKSRPGHIFGITSDHK